MDNARNLAVEIETRADTGDGEEKVIRAKLATDTPVEEFDHETGRIIPQILVPGGFRVESPKGQIPLLDSHDRFSIKSVLGSLRDITAGKKDVTATLHFEPGEDGQSARAKVESGHLTDVSVGFIVEEKTFIPSGEKRRVGTRSYQAGKSGLNVATRWVAKEGSLTPIGADHAAKIQRSHNTHANAMSTTAPTEPSAEDKRKAAALARDQNSDSVRAMGKQYGIPADEIELAIAKQTPEGEFRETVVIPALEGRKAAKDQEAKQKALHADLGLNRRELLAYSINRAAAQMATSRKIEGLELDVHNALADKFRAATGEEPDSRAILIPAEVTRQPISGRATNTATDAAGGHTVDEELLSMIDILRENLVVGRIGATVLSGLTGNLKWPRLASGISATWPGETGSTTPADLTFGELTMTPKRVSAESAYSLQLLNQSSMDVEALTRREIARAIGQGIDNGALYLDGTANDPVGLLNVSGTQSVTFGAAPTWAKVLEFDQLLEESNAPGSEDTTRAGWLTTSSVKTKWLSTVKFSNTSDTLAASPSRNLDRSDAAYSMATANGAPMAVTNSASISDKAIKGLWENLLVGLWGAMELVVDPYTGASTGTTRIVASSFADVGTRYADAFVISSDDANQ